MRKIAFVILFLFLFFAALALFLQGPWGREKMRLFLVEALQESGVEVNIEKIEGTLHKQIELKGVHARVGAYEVSAAVLQVRVSLLRLLKRELAFTEVRGDQIGWKKVSAAQGGGKGEGLPFRLNVKHFFFSNVAIPEAFLAEFEGRLRIGKENRSLFLDVRAHRSDRKEDAAHLRLTVNREKMASADLTVGFSSPQPFLLIPALQGRLSLRGPWSALVRGEGILRGEVKGTAYPIENQPWNFSGNFRKNDRLTFALVDGDLRSDWLHIKGDVVFHFQTLQANASWQLPRWNVQGTAEASWQENEWAYQIAAPSLEIKGILKESPHRILVGNTSFSIEKLQTLSEMYGTVQGNIEWKEANREGAFVPSLLVNAKATDFYWKELSSQEISLALDLVDPLQKAEGSLVAAGQRLKWRELVFHTAHVETAAKGGENWPFHFSVEGEWKHPLSLQCDGFWRYRQRELVATFQEGSGSFFNHPLVLATPVTLEWSSSLFRLLDLHLSLAEASLSGEMERKEERTDAHVMIARLPLDFLSLNPLDVPIKGLFHLDASLWERRGQLKGEWKASVEQMEVTLIGQQKPLQASGTCEGSFAKDQLSCQGALVVREAPLLTFDLSLPIHLEIWPFRGEFFYNSPMNGHFALRGKVEEFLDFLDLGTHRIEGECDCKIAFSHTLAHPFFEGYCHFENGYYENYYTGTSFQNLRAEWIFDKERLLLRSLTAQDGQKKGDFSAVGEVALRLKDHFPFHFDIAFSRLNCVQVDLVSAEAEGKISLRGDLEKGLASGNVEILQGQFHIPNRIPRSLPDLAVTYRNATKPLSPPPLEQKTPYPLFLDLKIDAPDTIFISGRGLDSEWRGNFQLSGTQIAPAAKGTLELIRGEFLFSGRTFRLTEGALSLSGVPNEMPHIDLAGEMETKGVSIIAHLKGPLNNPQITLRSSPPLPLSTILSYLLFGEDVAEINSFQALQLANSLASLAGEGPDVLETTRRSLGVDRLQIVTLPAVGEEEEGETIAVQVGKYVAEGVIVSFSQGAEDASGNVGVEVELKNGFSFQIQQSEEQGIFSLKWHLNY